eukprot:GFUD01012436.1.p1 GENE.GFUD01012436.1~~GFUD01012436.1.p1  ORF type:complete len:649 (-),score=97.52 GFUD01012436.1:25-1743(-)
MERKILNKPIVQKILEEGDKQYKVRLFDKWTLPQLMQEFSKGIIDTWNPNFMKTYDFSPKPDPFRGHLNTTQLKCRSYVKRLFELMHNDVIKEASIIYFTKNDTEQSVHRINRDSQQKLKFMTVRIMRSTMFFLILTMAWTLATEVKQILLNIFRSNLWPLLTNFKLACNENRSLSPLFQGRNTSNDYVIIASQRHNLNIQEATHETLSAINIQIALWVYMATFLTESKRLFKASFNISLDNKMYGLDEDAFTDFFSSAMLTSLVAGVISLTFAQYKQYMTRHGGDAEMKGKMVYLLACACNALAIFMTQTSYYSLGLPFLTNFLIVIIRYIVGFDQYDTMPSSADFIIIILVFVTVLMPLKFIPVLIAKLINHFTEEMILHKTVHMNMRNRSGYDVPGLHTALFMFLPSATNHHGHINKRGLTLSPGFYYFSKDPISRELFRLRFELQIFCKFAMHLFYLTASFVLVNMMHIILRQSTAVTNTFWLQILNVPVVELQVRYITLGMFPLLFLSFGLLHFYYKKCHPWLSEGVSVGFEPSDCEIWRPLKTREEGGSLTKPQWGEGVWHEHGGV